MFIASTMRLQLFVISLQLKHNYLFTRVRASLDYSQQWMPLCRCLYVL